MRSKSDVKATPGASKELGRLTGALALAAVEESIGVVLQGRLEVSTASDKLLEGERLVDGALVDDGCLVNGLVDRDGGLLGSQRRNRQQIVLEKVAP